MNQNEHSLEVYKQEINKDAINNVDYFYYNKSDFRFYMYSVIFRNAKENVNIAINSRYNNTCIMNDQDFIDGITIFLDKPGTVLKIIIMQCTDGAIINSDNLFYKALFEHPAYSENRIHIKCSKNEKTFRISSESEVNFCTGDSDMLNACIMDKNIGITNFNKPEVTAAQNKIFNEVFDADYMETVNLGDYFN